MVDKKYCMSSFLMYRMVSPVDTATMRDNFPDRRPIHTSEELEAYLRTRVQQATAGGKAALALSGGIDSAILARFMPAGSTAYTFKCVVPGVQVTDETPAAARYAWECGLNQKVVEIYWQDFEELAPLLMQKKGAPIHSIEVQIYKAAMQAKADGFDTLIFGEAADAVYGGQSNILQKDWLFGDFVERFSYVMPHRVLKEPCLVIEPFCLHTNDGIVDPYSFMSQVYINESVGSYLDAADTAGMRVVLPYGETYLAEPIDYNRIRSGENKYLVREVFKRLYPDFDVPPKVPMPRPMNEWMKDWPGPNRPEFWPHCTDNMTGDQKWMVFALEKFLDLMENKTDEKTGGVFPAH